MKLRFVHLSILILGAAGSSYAGTSVSLANTTASVPLPNTAPFNALGSYWIDYRITGWSIPASGCGILAHMPSGAGGSLQILLCEPARGFEPFILFPGNDGTPGGTGVLMAPPHIGVTSVAATNPMVLTLSSTPFALTMAVNATITVAGASGTGCAGLNANQKITAVSGNTITIAYNGTGCAYVANSAAAYSQDFVMRYHRDLTANQAIGEAWNVDGTGYAQVSYPITVPSLPTNPDSVTLGPASANVAFFRWYSGTIQAGSKPPYGSAPIAGKSILGDWEFEGNGFDSGPNRLTMSFSPAASFVATPRYAPACVPGSSQSWRVGTQGQLDGSQSFPLDDGSTLGYMWLQASSSEPGAPLQLLSWSSHTSATPTVSGFTAGPANFQLTVKDGSGGSSSCQVHNGAVATDNFGNVKVANAKIASLLGPMTQWGAPTSRWPWFDTLQKQWTDLFGGAQGTVQNGRAVSNYVDNWNVRQPGTVTATFGSVRVAGSNTHFKSTFCQGGSFSSNDIILWYPLPQGGTGRRGIPVGKCVSDTVLDLGWGYSDDPGNSASNYQLDAPTSFAYSAGAALIWRPGMSCAGGPTTINVNGLGRVPLKKADGVTDPSPSDCANTSNPNNGVNLTYNGSVFTIQGAFIAPLYYYWVWIASPGVTSGMNYALWTQEDLGTWAGNATNINFYDNVLAFYSMYYRTGIDTYLHYARWLADRWWTMPLHDQGNATNGLIGMAMMPRNQSVSGLFLRALDQDDISGFPGSSPMWAGLRNEIDNGYRYMMNSQVSYNMVTGDLRENAYTHMFVALCAAYDPDATHAAQCRSDLNNSILKTWKPQRQPDGSWQALMGSVGSVNSIFPIVNGPAPGTVTVTPGSNIVSIQGGTWSPSWLPGEFVSFADPMDPTTRDSGYYNATYVDATHLRLDRPYTDACGSNCAGRQWVIATGAPGTQAVGFGVQPFMLGITGQFFNQARIALSLDPQYATTAALAKSYVADVANWLGTKGTEPASRGLWYAVGFGVCSGSNLIPLCYSNGDPGDYIGSRELSPEVLGTMAMGYAYTGNSAILTQTDNLFSALYAKNPADPGYDGSYAQGMDPNGGYFWQTMNPKWLGFFWGMGRNASWLNVR